MIYLMRFDRLDSQAKHIKPGNYYIFTVSIERTLDWEKKLKNYRLWDKIIYRSEPAWTWVHRDRRAPSQFCVICKT